jgi:hypothetical protein
MILNMESLPRVERSKVPAATTFVVFAVVAALAVFSFFP